MRLEHEHERPCIMLEQLRRMRKKKIFRRCRECGVCDEEEKRILIQFFFFTLLFQFLPLSFAFYPCSHTLHPIILRASQGLFQGTARKAKKSIFYIFLCVLCSFHHASSSSSSLIVYSQREIYKINFFLLGFLCFHSLASNAIRTKILRNTIYRVNSALFTSPLESLSHFIA